MLSRTTQVTSVTISLLATTAALSAPDFARVRAHNFGYLTGYYAWQGGQVVGPFYRFNSTNTDNKPWGDGYQYESSLCEAYMEIAVADLPQQNHYYLELSPYSVFAKSGEPDYRMALDVFASSGDGLATESDGLNTAYFTRAYINDVSAGWYSPNPWGGYWGDTHVDITSLVESARQNTIPFISFRLAVPSDTSYLRGLYRTPFVIASNFPIPTPSALSFIALGGLLNRRRRN